MAMKWRPKMNDEVSVKELIQKISEDLLESEQERTERGQRPVFEVSELVIELAFVVSRTRQGQGGLDLRVVTVGGKAGRADEQTQRMTLRLVAVGGEEKRAADTSGTDRAGLTRLDYDDVLPVRPRLRGRTDS
jgi:Trypsin-co-occurring domain 2